MLFQLQFVLQIVTIQDLKDFILEQFAKNPLVKRVLRFPTID